MNKCFQILLFIAFMAGFDCFAGPKIDTLYFQSGDRITGEFKSLENNLVRFSTSDAATIQVKWDRIDSLCIKQYLRIELTNGELIYGSIYPTDSAKVDAIFGNFGVRTIQHNDIVRISPFHKNVVDRIDGSASTALSYTKATDLFKYDFAGSIKYSAERYVFEADYNGSFQQQKDYNKAERHNSTIRAMRLMKNKWFYASNISSERNSELGLDLRVNFGGSFGNNIVFTNYVLLYGALGAQVNREFAVDSVSNNAEAVLSIRYSVFKYQSPKLSLTLSANAYPNLTTKNRIRFETDANVRWEMFSDFYLKYNLYYTYDSKPLSENAHRTDYGTSFGIEYSF